MNPYYEILDIIRSQGKAGQLPFTMGKISGAAPLSVTAYGQLVSPLVCAAPVAPVADNLGDNALIYYTGSAYILLAYWKGGGI